MLFPRLKEGRRWQCCESTRLFRITEDPDRLHTEHASDTVDVNCRVFAIKAVSRSLIVICSEGSSTSSCDATGSTGATHQIDSGGGKVPTEIPMRKPIHANSCLSYARIGISEMQPGSAVYALSVPPWPSRYGLAVPMRNWAAFLKGAVKLSLVPYIRAS